MQWRARAVAATPCHGPPQLRDNVPWRPANRLTRHHSRLLCAAMHVRTLGTPEIDVVDLYGLHFERCDIQRMSVTHRVYLQRNQASALTVKNAIGVGI